MAGKSEIRIGYLNILNHFMMEMALGLGSPELSLGDFSKNGDPFSVATVRYDSWSAVSEAFCDEVLDGAFLPVPEIFSLYRSGLDIRLILLDSRPGTMILANRSAGVKRLIDFKNRTVLLSNSQSVFFFLLERLMKSAGLTLRAGDASCWHREEDGNNVYIEVVPPARMHEMLLCDNDGDIGGCLVEEPYASKMRHQGDGMKICLTEMMWPAHPHSALAIRRELMDHHGDALSVWIDALHREHLKIYRDSTHINGFTGVYFENEDGNLEAVCRDSLPRTPRSLMPDREMLEIVWRTMGPVESMDPKKKLSDLIDDRFAMIHEYGKPSDNDLSERAVIG